MTPGKPHVLVADDDRTTRLVVARALTSWGFTVEEVADGDSAWSAILANRARLIITNWQMPGLDGPTLCRRLRQIQGRAYSYVILLTSSYRRDDVVTALRAGADDFITKPFHPAELRVRLEVAQRVLGLEDVLRARNAALEEANAHLTRMATTDALMGIGNRRSFEFAIDAVHRSGGANGRGYGLLMADVDRFKDYNDLYGHPAGDRALANIARRMASRLRTDDRVFRYGGEELIVVIPECSIGVASRVAEGLRIAVAELAIPHQAADGGQLTISIGGTCFDSTAVADESWPDVVERADRALYQAKLGGRNRTCITPATAAPLPNAVARGAAP